MPTYGYGYHLTFSDSQLIVLQPNQDYQGHHAASSLVFFFFLEFVLKSNCPISPFPPSFSFSSLSLSCPPITHLSPPWPVLGPSPPPASCAPLLDSGAVFQLPGKSKTNKERLLKLPSTYGYGYGLSEVILHFSEGNFTSDK